jgi:hypothetical protein
MTRALTTLGVRVRVFPTPRVYQGVLKSIPTTCHAQTRRLPDTPLSSGLSTAPPCACASTQAGAIPRRYAVGLFVTRQAGVVYLTPTILPRARALSRLPCSAAPPVEPSASSSRLHPCPQPFNLPAPPLAPTEAGCAAPFLAPAESSPEWKLQRPKAARPPNPITGSPSTPSKHTNRSLVSP